MIGLKHFRDTAKGLPDLLNYAAAIDEGIFLNKDGSLSAGFIYRASDITSLTLNDRNHISARMNNILMKFGTGWTIHIDAFRKSVSNYIDPSKNHFNDPISKLIELEREELFIHGEHYETTLTFFLTYLPPHVAKSRISDLMFDDNTIGKNTSTGDKLLRFFKGKLDEFEGSCSNILSIQRMMPHAVEDEFGKVHIQDDFLSYVNFTITGEHHPVNLPPVGMYMDSYIGGQQFYSGVTPKVGDKFISAIAIDGFPQESYPNILSRLGDLNLNYRWNTRYIFIDQHEADSIFTSLRRKWGQVVRGWKDQLLGKADGRVNEHAVSMVQEIDSAIAEVNSGLMSYGYLTTNIILLDTARESLDFNSREIKRIIENLGFNARIEDINTVEAWLGSLPSHCVQNVRRPLMNTFNLSHMMPLDSIWAGEEYHPSDKYLPMSPPLAHAVTSGATPFRLNLHVSDIGHTLIFGPTGAGKSTLLAFLVTSHRRYHKARVVVFDKGRSLYPLTSACGGLHFDVSNEESRLAFAPLANLKTEVDKAWASTWIETLLTLQGLSVTPNDRKLIYDALKLHISTGSKSLTEFVSNIQNSNLRAALEHYTLAGSMGFLLDSEEDGLALSDFTTFELEDLMNLGEKNLVPVLLYLFRRIELSLDGSPTMLVLDEAWIALGHPVFKEKIREWLKVLRKANCFVVMATQSLSDASKSGILDVLQESCPTKILLPNQDAYNTGSEHSFGPYDFYKQFGLNHVQIGILATATKKRDYYYISPLGTRLFQLSLGKIALAFTASADKESIAAIRVLEEQHAHQWPYRWLEYKGVAYNHLLAS